MTKTKEKGIELWSDGGCNLKDSGRGGWGYVLVYRDLILEGYGGRFFTTNNQMELTAVIQGLNRLSNLPAETRHTTLFTVFSDSQYVIKGASEWIKGWKKKKFSGVKNPEFWQELDVAASKFKRLNWKWVRGHSGILLNERADELATLGMFVAQKS